MQNNTWCTINGITDAERIEWSSKDQWLAIRKNGIGGSDIPAILGLDGRTPLTVYINKVDNNLVDKPNNYMRWGNVLEPVVAEEYSKDTGIKATRINATLRSKKTPFAQYNMDRLIVNKGTDNEIFEIKTTRYYTGDTPLSHIAQTMWGMYVTGLRKGRIVTLDLVAREMYADNVEYNQDTIDFMLAEAAEFWECVQAQRAPMPDGTKDSTEIIKQLYPAARGEQSIALPAEASKLIHEYKEASKNAKQWKEIETANKNQLCNMLQDNPTGLIDNYVVSWANTKRTNFDSTKLKAEYPAIYQSYASESQYRRFSIKAVKKEKN